MLTIAIIMVLFVLLQSFVYMSAEKTETQKYAVVFEEEGLEIRLYPAATMATIHADAKTYKELSGPGFRKLAGYIFGGNQQQEKIAMTTPVHMNINDSSSTMSFVMPSKYDPASLPKPNDPNVIIQAIPQEYVAAIRFGGYASDEDMKLYTEKLTELLTRKGIPYYGSFRFLGYNAPYQFAGRRNEIIVGVKWDSKPVAH